MDESHFSPSSRRQMTNLFVDSLDISFVLFLSIIRLSRYCRKVRIVFVENICTLAFNSNIIQMVVRAIFYRLPHTVQQ